MIPRDEVVLSRGMESQSAFEVSNRQSSKADVPGMARHTECSADERFVSFDSGMYVVALRVVP